MTLLHPTKISDDQPLKSLRLVPGASGKSAFVCGWRHFHPCWRAPGTGAAVVTSGRPINPECYQNVTHNPTRNTGKNLLCSNRKSDLVANGRRWLVRI
jgi:hypothetical protein